MGLVCLKDSNQSDLPSTWLPVLSWKVPGDLGGKAIPSDIILRWYRTVR